MLEGCVIHCSRNWQSCSLPSLVRTLGGTYSEALDASCTHVLTSSANSHRRHIAQAVFPHIPVLHPRWLWACYWSLERPLEESFAIDFYMEALRTGTCTSMGSKHLFYCELPLFHVVENHVLPHGIRGRCMANLLSDDSFAAESQHWPFVCRMLQHTTFWGRRVRSINWARRRTLAMCLFQHRMPPAPRKRMRACHDGPVPVLRRVARLPPELWMHVITYV